MLYMCCSTFRDQVLVTWPDVGCREENGWKPAILMCRAWRCRSFERQKMWSGHSGGGRCTTLLLMIAVHHLSRFSRR